MATTKTTKTTPAKATAKAAPAKKATAAKSTKVAKAAKPEVPETADLFECACEATPAKKCAAKAAPKAEKKSRVTFTVRAEIGSKVFLAGSFNDWDPTAKQMEDKKGTGEFTCVLNLPKGKYEYKFVIDGVWCADCECPDWVQNDMGSMNSVKIVD